MSRFIKLNRVHFSYNNLSDDLLSDVSIACHEGWSSICGANGSGKSTLFKLMMRTIVPTAGNVEVLGTLCAIPQETELPPQNLLEFRTDYSRLATRLRTDLKIVDEWFDRWESLSIGERKRMQIAAALVTNPSILLVDEPTNHVDEETKHTILRELKSFGGVGVLISHDRLLLNKLCTTTIFIESGSCVTFHAPYDAAQQELLNNQKSASRNRQLKKREVEKVTMSAQKQAEKVAKGQKKLSKKNLAAKDSDARAKINLARLTGADLADSRKKRVLEDRSIKLTDELSDLKVKKEFKLGVFFGEMTSKKRLHLPQGSFATSYLTIAYPDLVLEPGERLAMTGANGVGKTTFMNLWLEQLSLSRVTIASQELSSADQQHLKEELSAMDSESKGKVLTLVSCFGSDPKSIVAGSIPSPGVWQKIVIAKAIVEGSPVLFLDEPTNHMDLRAIEILEEALQLYKGILVVISHDRAFVNKVCTRELRFTKQQGPLTHVELYDLVQDKS